MTCGAATSTPVRRWLPALLGLAGWVGGMPGPLAQAQTQVQAQVQVRNANCRIPRVIRSLNATGAGGISFQHACFSV